MLKIENVEVAGWEHAIRGMRNPTNSREEESDGPIATSSITPTYFWTGTRTMTRIPYSAPHMTYQEARELAREILRKKKKRREDKKKQMDRKSVL